MGPRGTPQVIPSVHKSILLLLQYVNTILPCPEMYFVHLVNKDHNPIM